MQLCYNGLVRKTSSILLAMLGLRAFALSVPELPRTDYADTEVSTNVTLTALFLCAWNCWVSERISELCAAWKRSSFVTRVVSVAFVGILMAYASTKPPENGQEGRYLCLVSSLPEGQSEVSEPDPHRGETILTREWNLPGAWQYSMRRQDFAGGFVFPYGTNHLACVHVSSQGSVRETRFSTNVIASVGVPLAVVPGLTECSHEYTVSNTYRFVWANAAADRDTNTLVSASIELFRNGDVVVTTNGITRTIPRELPFEHDGYGQDESWVRANFAMLQDIDASLTNVEQVLSIGYTNWIDRLVGVGQLNGLYKFTAEFTEDPPETTQFWIGDFSLAVTNAGKYVVVLEKGEEYEFGTWPFNDDVDYWAQDDLADDAPMLTAWWGGWESPGEWTIDGGWNLLYCPYVYRGVYYRGRCSWWPTLQGSPDVIHLGESDLPKLFSAMVYDYPDPDSLTFYWNTSDENIHIDSPHLRQTMVSVDDLPSWNHFNLSVSTVINGYYLYSTIGSCSYGTNEYPQVRLGLNVPKGIPVKGDRLEAGYSFECDVETNGWLVLEYTSSTNRVSLWQSPTNDVAFVCSNKIESVSNRSASFYVYGENRSRSYQDVLWKLSFHSASGETNIVSTTSTVFGCYCQPIMNERIPGGIGFYNSCSAMVGTNVWFRADVVPTLPPDKVAWRVVNGSLQFPDGSNGQRIRVSGDSVGDVTLGVTVLDYTDERMKFDLEVVE